MTRTAGPTGGGKIRIEYFENTYGRADPIVQLLEHKGVEYEYVGLSFP